MFEGLPSSLTPPLAQSTPAQQRLRVPSRMLSWALPALGLGNQEELPTWLSLSIPVRPETSDTASLLPTAPPVQSIPRTLSIPGDKNRPSAGGVSTTYSVPGPVLGFKCTVSLPAHSNPARQVPSPRSVSEEQINLRV